MARLSQKLKELKTNLTSPLVTNKSESKRSVKMKAENNCYQYYVS